MQQFGIYEQLITQVVEQQLDRERFYVGERQLESDEAAIWLSRFMSKLMQLAIDSIPAGEKNRLEQQILLANKFVFWLKDQLSDTHSIEENLVNTQGKILTALFDKRNPLAADLAQYSNTIFPQTGLTQSELFSGANAGLSLESELKREIQSSDTIYWLVSFIRWTGIRIFKEVLQEFTQSGKKLKVITTSYMGATDQRAIDFLADLPNTEVKISYNTRSERLHAKSYLFMRNNGFHTGYIGSSNLSYSALSNGLEWNLKITSQEIPHIIKKSLSTFETYWESDEFKLYTGQETCKQKLKAALSNDKDQVSDVSHYYFDLAPKPHQRTILDKLSAERTLHNRTKNLVVAATGTGKTLISAFDFQQFIKDKPETKLLFVAHREEILKQARGAFRTVLKDNQFGELWVGNHKPDHYRQLFASVQTLNNQLDSLNLTADYFDYIVIDEVHHIAARSYRDILKLFTPQILLGLTATPERQDGGNILNDFDGVIAAELRLPEAINQRHLCPFHYFAIDDETDLRTIPWKQGRYEIAALTRLYTHNDQRARRIIASMQDILVNVHHIKALAFCVSKVHADFMAKQFNLNGINANVLTSDNTQERHKMQTALRNGDINILCVVDIFNEGVDIPEVDTLLFLRPTESLTLFLQQLGRGLRLSNHEKECCTVLDFVGNARPEYDFATKFRALIGKTNTAIDNEIKDGFPHLPLGCRIELQKQSKEVILNNIRKAENNLNRLRALINRFAQDTKLPLTLANFLQVNASVTLEDAYKAAQSGISRWHILTQPKLVERELLLIKAYNRAINTQLLVCNSLTYLSFLNALCDNQFDVSQVKQFDSKTKDALAMMTFYNFWEAPQNQANSKSVATSLRALNHPVLTAELKDVLPILINRVEHLEQPLTSLPNKALQLHSRYTREQIFAAMGEHTFAKRSSSREGVKEFKSLNIEILFVTLNKCEKVYSPTTLYNDYAISPTLFHWQSQNTARPERGKGLSYIQHKETGKRLFLFVREQNKDENGRTMGFVNFGEVSYVQHQGSQPMDITWKLNHPMPNDIWHEAGKLAVG
ncbi:DEAD/DEAH box helicase [Pseudoalteromonas ardens]|uniref:Restriction endonuclease subunit R n=1 Tax=Pseudoalteromonas rubra TaxID=43658 RepID=A0A0L0ETG7_9GAMM|nr:DEAD/DEAH box helicase [Pseudoalteromonas sp. R96]KNC67665.1 restriction endonuclease subunit R [Pseudoalteromonas rubra]MDK1309816.1 DUF3427 domain-containing protein [Pseudoalteromonas sp. R96]